MVDAAHDAGRRRDGNAGTAAALDAVVLDHVAAAVLALQVSAGPESANFAVAHGDVLPVHRGDAMGQGIGARRQAAELEIVAVDGDVVGGDGDGVEPAGLGDDLGLTGVLQPGSDLHLDQAAVQLFATLQPSDSVKGLLGRSGGDRHSYRTLGSRIA